MESSFGAGVDPSPFIAAAYGLGTLMIFGYAVWTLIHRRHLQRLLIAVSGDTQASTVTSSQGSKT